MQFLGLSFWEEAIRGLQASLCQVIYPLIAWLYNLFLNLAKVNILSEETVYPIYQRVTMLLTIIMVFYVTFQFVKYIVQPDDITDKEKGAGKIIYKMIAVVVLIAFVPKLFEGAFWVQEKVVSNDLIGKLVIGQASSNVENFGGNFSANIFALFYKFEVNEEKGVKEDQECDDVKCKIIVTMNLNRLRDKGELTYLTIGLNESKKVDTNVKGRKEEMALIDFNGWMAIIVGAVVVWMLVMYCIEVGVRWAQLVFLQIIAPIPIIGYLSPKKDGIFQKWTQQCFTTYIDLFLRMGIIYFVLLICQILTTSFTDGLLLQNLYPNIGSWTKTFVYIVLILGLMLFAAKAPKMLEELFPKKGAASGNFGLSGKARFEPVANAVKKGYGAVRGVKRAANVVVGGAAGALAGAVMGARTGRFFSGMVKGAKAGGQKKGFIGSNIKKGINDVRKDVEADKDRKANGGTYFGGRFRSGHYETVAREQDRQVSDLKDMTKKKKAVGDAVGDIKFRKQMDSIGEAIKSTGNTAAAQDWDGKKKEAEKYARQYAAGEINETQFKTLMNNMVNKFNTDHTFTGTTNEVKIDDKALEIGSDKWTKVTVAIDDARKTAMDLDKKKYQTEDGKQSVEFEYKEDTFGEDLGDYADKAEAAETIIETSKEYKMAHANKEGSGK